jgi:methylamine dehydrogenase accessory protein MauD
MWLVSYLVLWVIVACLAVLSLALFRQLGLQSLNTVDGISRDGLAIGSPAPSVDGFGSDRYASSLGKRTLLVFASASCRPCQALMPALDEFVNDMRDLATTYVVLAGSPENADRQSLDTRTLKVVRDEKAADRFLVRVTPFAFIVGDDGLIQAKGLVNDRDHLENLWHDAVRPTGPTGKGAKHVPR